GTTKDSAYASRQSSTTASTAPAARARSRMASQSPPCPTSAASAITSTPNSSPSQRTATDVSSPPLYASTTLFVISAPSQPCQFAQLAGHLGPADALGRHDEDRVV